MPIENNNLDCLHDIYSRAQDRLSYTSDHTPFKSKDILEIIAHELVALRITLQDLIQ